MKTVSKMHTFLKIIRTIAQLLARFFLVLVLGTGLTLLAVTIHLTNRETVKNWPAEAGVYENVVDTLPELIAEESRSSGNREGQSGGEEKTLQESLDESGLDQDALLDAIKDTITSEYLQSQTNIALDAMYDGLEGKTDVVTFELKISEKSKELTDTLKEELVSQVEQYPTCTAAELAELQNPDEFNPLEAHCIPPGANFRREINKFSGDLSGGKDSVVKDVEVTAGDLDFVNSNLSLLQDSFAIARVLPQIVIGLVLLFGALVVILAPSLLRGIRKFGSTLFVQGILLAILYFFLQKLSRATVGNIGSGDEGTDIPKALAEKIIQPLFKVALDDIASTGLQIALLTASVGAACWLGVYTWHKIHHHPHDAPLQPAAGTAGSKKQRNKEDASDNGAPKEY